jgi:hypothetical protein
MRPILAALVVYLVAACAGPGGSLVPGQSTVTDVEAAMGKPAETHQVGAETVYYYPQLPWGYRTYAARIGADGRLIALEQRLTEENTARIVKGRTKQAEVRDLLGPPYEPQRVERMDRDIWTYPMRVGGNVTPKWFLVQMSLADGVVRETYLMDDPNYNRWGGARSPH